MNRPKLKNRSNSRKLTMLELTAGLKSDGIITDENVRTLNRRSKISKISPILIISNTELLHASIPNTKIDLKFLMKWLSKYSNIDIVEIDPLKLDIEKITKLLPKAYIKRIGVLPISVTSKKVTFATSEPFNKDWMLDTSASINRDIEIKLASPILIQRLMNEFYDVRSAITSIDKENGKLDDSAIQKLTSSELNTFTLDDGNVAKIVDWVFQYALEERATDIHLEAKDGYGLMRYRIDGTLRVVYKFAANVFLPVVARVKIMAGMKVDEKRRPQDGRIKRKISKNKLIELRLSSIPTHFGEKLVIRIFDPGIAEKTFSDLGFDKYDIEKWKQVISKNYGLILVTGPTGSGKTTTLQASLNYLSSPEINICTVEDPIEIVNENFNQMQVHEGIGLNFAGAIRSFLRQDPDVIMVGEIRDKETAEMAIQSSLTGHLVLSTLHTNTALASINRLLDLGVESHLLNASLVAVMAQRLVRILCTKCKVKKNTDKKLWESIFQDSSEDIPESTYCSKGCSECKNTGFIGRICIYELVELNSSMLKYINKDVTLSELQENTKGDFQNLKSSAVKKVKEGITSVEEIIRVIL
ncbi:MAG: type II/IV secretion system protein [Bdellovibrionales bacterium]|nr:type II/IV secretion system protein [Bdellovibrionales bacterium]